MRLRPRIAGALLAAAVLTAACGQPAADVGARQPSPTASAPAVAEPGRPSADPNPTEVVGLLDQAPDPNDLDDRFEALRSVVGIAATVGPAGCWRGLPDAVEPGNYVLGVIADSEEEVHRLLGEAGETPFFVGTVQPTCGL